MPKTRKVSLNLTSKKQGKVSKGVKIANTNPKQEKPKVKVKREKYF